MQKAKRIIRSDAFFDRAISLEAFKVIIQCLEIASLPYYPASLHLQSYISAYPVDSSAGILAGVRTNSHNIFLDIYRRGILEDIRREKPDVIGISIPSMPQMLAGMTLAYLIKATGLDCHVTVGGPHITMLRDELPKVPALFSLIDSAVVFDGEVPLLRLVEALADDHDLSHVPNLIYQDGDRIRVNDRKPQEKIQDLPLPDFDGLPLDRYLAPHLVLPLLTARGCYYGKCAFCNVGYGGPEAFSQLRAEKLAEQMIALHQKYGTRHIFFADEAVTPRNLRHLSPILEAAGQPVHWAGCVALRESHLPGLAAKHGARRVQYDAVWSGKRLAAGDRGDGQRDRTGAHEPHPAREQQRRASGTTPSFSLAFRVKHWTTRRRRSIFSSATRSLFIQPRWAPF